MTGVDSEARRLVAEVENSHLASSDEAEMARAALEQITSLPPGDERGVIFQNLQSLAQIVRDRATGRMRYQAQGSRDPYSLLSLYGIMSRSVSNELQSQSRRLSKARSIVMVTAGVFLTVAVLSGVVPLTVGLAGLTASLDVSVMSVIAISSCVAASLVCFRAYQVLDHAARQVEEKKVSLAFVEYSISVALHSPESTVMLEKSFEMFLTHHSEGGAPLKVRDVLFRSAV